MPRAVALLSLVLLLAACGAETSAPARKVTPAMSADERAIRETLKRYVAATRANDAKAVCALTAREVLDQIDQFGVPCEQVIADQVREGGPKYTLTVTSVEITGDYAITHAQQVESDGARNGDQPLVREHGRWLLTTKAR